VTVIGGGVWGLACAWEMARRGARVRLIERDRIGAGASGGVVGALAPHAPERWGPLKAFQLDSLLAAEGFWAGVADASGLSPGYARSGRLQPVADAVALARAVERSDAARALWRGAADWRVIDATEAGDWVPASPTGKLVHETLAARLHPRQACAALAAAIRVRGGDVMEGGGEVRPELATEPVIWATGAAGLAEVSAAFGRDVGRPVKGQAAVLGLDRPDAPQIGGDGLFVVPHEDGTVAVGSTAERDFGDPRTTDAQLDEVIARARAAVPALREAPVLQRWAGLRPRARSRRPMLGEWPGRPGHFVANGGFKIGFGLAPGIAGVMADLVLEGVDAIPEGCRVEDSL
jgi:glycine/D-amino acid oxidase-like deaminating enzyme